MKLTLKNYQLHFKHTFRVAGAEAKEWADIGIVRLTVPDGIGFGEAAPSKFWGEDMDMVRNAVSEIDIEEYDNPLDYESILQAIQQKVSPPKSLLAAIDMALFDCIGKMKAMPVWEFLGVANNRIIPTSFTIGYADLDVIEKKVKEAELFPILKLKLGTSYDIEIVEKVRSLTDKPVRVDANEGWLKEEALEKIRWLESQDIELIEQPLKADQIEETLWVKERTNLPIIADESIKDSSDIPKIARSFDGINIKLMKCGGIAEAVRTIKAARENNLKIMLGCMTETSLGISAAAQLLPLVDYADLDSHMLITNDPFEGLTFQNGELVIGKQPGLGVALKNNHLFG